MPTIGNFFVGERVQVRVPIGKRHILAVPPGSITTRAGIDFITIVTGTGKRDVAVIAGETVATSSGDVIEILTGLKKGDRVVTP